MKLTDKQLSSLQILQEEKTLSHVTSKVNKNTMNSLYFKGLVRSVNYANGLHWEMTDRGIELLNKQSTK